MNISDLLGAMVQSGMTPSTNQRLRNAVGGREGGGSLADGLGGLLGGQKGGGGGLGDLLSGRRDATRAEDTPQQGGGGGLGDLLGGLMKGTGGVLGGNQNVAMGGLGALVGALLGGGGRSARGALGGGVMALLAAMAFKALQGTRQGTGQVPLGLMEPQTDTDKQELEQHAELVLMAMINAAKADGRIEQGEEQRIVGKLQEFGADQEDQRYVLAQMQKPMETEKLISAAKGRPEIAAQIYAASLIAIEVDTVAEKAYLRNLASSLGLTSDVTQNIEQMVGLQIS